MIGLEVFNFSINLVVVLVRYIFFIRLFIRKFKYTQYHKKAVRKHLNDLE